jgi:hypothetical protein
MMICLKRYQRKGMPVVFSQKGSILIQVSAFLLTGLFMLSMATVVAAQIKDSAYYFGPPTLREERILNKHKIMRMKNYDNNSIADFYQELDQYRREGCKEALAGEWEWTDTRDVITITYNPTYNVFEGALTRRATGKVRMDLPINHLLFKVYFPNDPRDKITQNPDSSYVLLGDKEIPILMLREEKSCFNSVFKGIEYSFDERTKKKTELELWLVFRAGHIEYKVDKQAYYMKRPIR